jgi:geranylgeranyl diphosphate synthase type I
VNGAASAASAGSAGSADTTPATAPAVIARARELILPALRASVDALDNEQMRLIAAYQLGWCDGDGKPIEAGGGKAIRPTFAILSAEAGGGTAADGVPAAVAVELIHNFSLLHDDIMDGDRERRHRPTGWVVFGEGQTILAGTAMLTVAIETLVADGPAGQRALPCLLRSTQLLISGQSSDLYLEGQDDVNVEDVLQMEAGKTAALLACSASIGALAAGASADIVDGLAEYGHDLGMSFQLVDDVLGVIGDPAVTGKSSSSDVRAGKRSAPVVAALQAGGAASRQLGELLASGPPSSEAEVALATQLIQDAGGVAWASAEAATRLDRAITRLGELGLPPRAAAEMVALGRYIVERDR